VRALVERGCTAFVEIGPKPVLSGMAKAVAGPDALWLPSLRPGRGDWATLLRGLAELHVRGAEVDWAALDRHHPRRRVVLPTYPFQRRRHWMTEVSPAAPVPAVQAPEGSPTVLGTRLSSPLAAVQYQALLTVDEHPCLDECVFEGTAVVNAGFYTEAALEAAADLHGLDQAAVTGLVIPRGLVITADGRATTQLVVEPGADRTAFRFHSKTADGDWLLHARGGITAAPERADVSAAELAAIRERCRGELTGSGFYRSMWRRGLHFGPSAQWHDRIERGSGEVLSWMRAAHPDERDRYRLHPGIVDAALQLLSVCPSVEVPPSTVFMLVEVAEFAFYGHDGGPLLCHAALRSDPADPATAESMDADIRLFTEDGRLVAALRGVHMRRTNRAALARSAEASAGVSRPTPPPAARAAAPVSAGGHEALRAAVSSGAADAPELLRTLLVNTTATVLGSSAAEVDVSEPLQNLGLDSLLAVELKDAVSAALGSELSAAVFMDNPSIAGLVDTLLPRLRTAPAVTAPAATAPAVTVPAVEPVPGRVERTGPGGIHVVELGDGPPVVFVHGGAVGGPDAWQTQVALADRWRLVIPFRPNYAPSPSTGREDFDEDAPLIAELLGDGAHLVAQSYGTVGAMLAALRRPEAVWSLTLIESGLSAVARGNPVVDDYERTMRELLAAPPEDPEERLRAVFAVLEPSARFKGPLSPHLLDFGRRVPDGVRWPWEADLPTAELRALPFPKLVVSGGQRPLFEVISDALADQLDGERLVIPGGHATQNVGSAFNQALADFLTRARPL
jgi:pimeloyl-ACP methyl ester carboxylesterase/acyl carrier protein